jgi:hypothetical protein
MKFLLIAIAALCLNVSAQQKYSDMSDSLTEMLLGATKGTGFSSVQSKIGALTSNMDNKGTSSSKIQSSVLDLLNVIEQKA